MISIGTEEGLHKNIVWPTPQQAPQAWPQGYGPGRTRVGMLTYRQKSALGAAGIGRCPRAAAVAEVRLEMRTGVAGKTRMRGLRS